MKLFTKEIDKKLFAQYHLGNNLEEQYVVAKIFNPYGNGRWYLLNSDPNDADYLWAIVQMGNVVEVGSVSRHDLENARVSKFRLPLERDLSFKQEKADVVLKGLMQGKFFKHGGSIHKDDKVVYEEVEFEEYKHGGMMAKGGKIYSIEKNGYPFDWGTYTMDEAKEVINKQEKDGSYYRVVKYNEMRESLPAIDRMETPMLNEESGEYIYSNSRPFSEGDLAEYSHGGMMADGGQTHFKDKVKAIEKRLKGTKVKPKYQSKYGKKYNKEEAHEAASNIAGAIVKKYKMK